MKTEIKMWIFAAALLATAWFVSGTVYAAQEKKETKLTDLGSPLVVVKDDKGKDHVVGIQGVIMQLGSDGLIHWKLSPALQKQLEDAAEKNILMPAPARQYGSGK